MTYKENCKATGSVLAKLLIVKDVLIHKIPQKAVARIYSCHKNTVYEIVRCFRENAREEHHRYLKNQASLTKNIIDKFSFFEYESRAPKSHPKMATKEQENEILKIFKEKRNWGAKRVWNYLNTRIEISYGITKGVFKRHRLSRAKVRTKNGNRRSIYNMHELRVFEIMQIDVKYIADQKALPKEVYDFYKKRDDIPSYQWTFFFPKCRIKFLLFGSSINSHFGLLSTIYVLHYLRSRGIHYPITVVKDGGPEYTQNSTRKEYVWNHILSKLNACTRPVNGKENNFIERTHRTDDEEFYVPQTYLMHNVENFINEADRYIQIFNHKRKHGGIQDQTPAEAAYKEGVYNIRRIITDFRPFILEDFDQHLFSLFKEILDVSEIRDKSGRYAFEKYPHHKKSHYVLTLYQNSLITP